MKYIFKSLNFMVLVLVTTSLYLSRCDSEYKEKCHQSSDFCSGYMIGEAVSSVTEGYKTGYTNNQGVQLSQEIEQEFGKKKIK